MIIVTIIMFIIILASTYWAFYVSNPTVALAALFGPLLAWFAGAGLKGSLRAGPMSQQLGGTILTLILGFFAYWIVSASGFELNHSNVRIDGEWWAGICFIIGMLGWSHRYTARF